MRLIDADELKTNLKEKAQSGEYLEHWNYIFAVDAAPTVEAELVKHSKWECVNADENVYMCNDCGWEIKLETGNPKKYDFCYCPYCGAKMEDEK